MTARPLYVVVALASIGTWGGLSAWRYSHDHEQSFQAGARASFRGSRFDPRGFASVDRIEKKRESESFKARLRSGNTTDLSWPGLKSAQVSWTWLELLQGLHIETSYEGDFSWMFSKLNTLIANSPPQEQRFVAGLGAFFYAIGRDHAGATLLFNEMTKRAANVYHTWFWGGYHAYYNLKSNPLAGNCWGKASTFPGAPSYLISLMARLEYDKQDSRADDRLQLIEKNTAPELFEKLKIFLEDKKNR